MASRFLDRINGEVLICDGAMGTQLDARGMEPGACRERWNVERPDEVRAIHRGYLEAGADIVLTNSFGGTRWVLGRHGAADRLEELNRAAARVARQAVEESGQRGGRLVFGDIGPTGELIEPLGPRTVEECEAVFAEQARALAAPAADGGEPLIDAIIVETMIAVEECAAAVRAAKAATDLPVLASMAFDFNPRRDGFFTAMGVGLEVMVRRLTEAGADVIGANCGTIDIAQMARLVEELAALTSRPIIAQPNAGTPRLVGGVTRYTQTPEDFAAGAAALVRQGRAGNLLVGGCCGTTPAHIAALARAIRDTA